LLGLALGLPCCGGTGSTGSGSGGGAQVAPLGASEFVFVREVRPGTEHILAYDVGTRAERLVSALDDDAQSGRTSGLASRTGGATAAVARACFSSARRAQ
jgi:hypothetical protein